MKRSFILSALTVCVLNINAQTYLDHLQTREVGMGTVSVHQSQEIDKLVNGTCPMVIQVKKTVTPAKEEPHEKTATTPEMTKKMPEHNENEIDIASIDTSKKVMRNAYKVTGYRVQVFAGSNSRNDKNRAESICNQIKTLFPDQPVYCHFYSPRWICRMGNYRTYEEAQAILNKVHAMGYRQASIVKGQITVTN